MSERIRPDTFYPLRIEQTGREYLLNAKYDKCDYFDWLGHFVLKVFDDEQGLVSLHVDDETALTVVEYAEIPIVPRKFIFQSEYDGYLKGLEGQIEGWV